MNFKDIEPNTEKTHVLHHNGVPFYEGTSMNCYGNLRIATQTGTKTAKKNGWKVQTIGEFNDFSISKQGLKAWAERFSGKQAGEEFFSYN
jgi:hypothetical protein